MPKIPTTFHFIILSVLLLVSSTSWSASGISYHGRIIKPDNTPLESATTRFRIQIKSPNAENCLLWEEEQTKNLLGSNGAFSITIGDSTDISISYLRVDGYSWGMERVFSNRSQFSALVGCSVGTVYVPGASDGRILEVSFKEAPTDPTWEAFPATKVNLIPMAFNSLQLEGYRADEFLKIDPYVNQTPLTNAGVNTLLGLVAGTSNLYVKPADPLGGDLSGTIGAGTVVGIRGRAVGVAVPIAGQILKFNGTTWEPAADDTGGATGDASYAAKGVVQINTDLATSGLFIASGVLALPNVITAGGPTGTAQAVPVITYDQKGRLTAVSTATIDDTTKLPLAGGTMTGPINMGGQNITNATSIAATNFSGRNLLLSDSDTNIATIRAPVNLAVDYALTLPTAAPTNGYVLSTDAAGQLSWIAASTGSVTSVGATAPVLTTGGTTPVISLDTGLLANKVPQVGGTALGANGVVVANGLGTALSSLNCTVNQVIKFDASGFAVCGADDAGAANAFVQNGNSFGAPAVLGTNDNNSLSFETNSTNQMTILPSGNVGVGTAAPGSRLQVAGGDIQLDAGRAIYGTNGNGSNYFLPHDGADAQMNIGTGGKFIVRDTVGNIRASFSSTASGGSFISNGNVGIGTTTPGSALDVRGGSAEGAYVGNLRLTNGNGEFLSFENNSGQRIGAVMTTASGDSTVRLYDTGGVLRVGMTVDSSSQPHLLAESPGSALTDGATNAWGSNLFLGTHVSTAENGIAFNYGGASSSPGAAITYYGNGSTSDGGLKFKTNNGSTISTRMTITPTGNVGIGTTTPGSALDVKGAIRISGATSGYVGFQVPAVAGTTTYTLPIADGSTGQVLSTNGSGVLAWADSASGAITSLGGLSAASQTFANGSTGTAPAFVSATSTHTLNIPLASGAGVTSGTISKTEYDDFTAKLTSPLTTKGDLLSRDGTTHVRLPAGADGTVLKANSAAASGLEWGGLSAATDLTGILPVANGGTNSSAALTNGKVMVSSAGTIIEGNASNTAKSNNTFVMRDGSGNIAGALGTFDQLALNGSVTGTLNVYVPSSFTNWNLTLPVDDGTSGQVLSTDGSGVTSWASAVTNGSTILAADGTAGAPGFAFNSAGNADNGMFLPAANQIALSTDGSERVRIDASGNVGIGTTTPSTSLEIAGAKNAMAGVGNEVNHLLFLRNTNGSDGQGAGIAFEVANSAGVIASIVGVRDGSGVGDLRFFTSNVSDTPIERVRIERDGNVGIGTTNPTALTHIMGTNAAGNIKSPLTVVGGNSTDGNIGGSISLTGGNGDTAGGSISLKAGDGYWGGGSVISLIGGAGQSGVNNTGSAVFTIGSGTGTGVPGTISATTASGLNGNAGGNIAFDTGGGGSRGYLLLNQSGGNVGIGIANPAGNLHVKSTGGANVLFDAVNSGSSTTFSLSKGGAQYLELHSGAASNTVSITNKQGAGALQFGAGNVVGQVTILPSGNVGIGTASPTSKIHGVASMAAATGNEVAYSLDYTTNKATSGNDTGLLISMTDTASPGTSKPLDIKVGGSSVFSVSNTGVITGDGSGITNLPSGGFANGGNSFGTTTTIGTNDNNALNFEVNNSTYMAINTGGGLDISGANFNATSFLNINATTKDTSSNASSLGNAIHISTPVVVNQENGIAFTNGITYSAINGYTSDLTGYGRGGLKFKTSSTGGGLTTRMTIGDTGNVGIGTTLPLNRLSVKASALNTFSYAGLNTSDSAIVKIGDDSNRGLLQVLDDAGATVSQLSGYQLNNPLLFLRSTVVNQNTEAGSPFSLVGSAAYIQVNTALNSENGIFFSSSPSGGHAGAGITHYVSDGGSYGVGGLKFKTSTNGRPTTRMTIDQTGSVGIGTTSPGAKFDVTDTGTTTSAIIVPRAGNFTGTTVNGMIRYNTASTLFEFYQNGAWVNYTTVSDSRLKTNVVPVTDALDIVNQLNPVFYDWDRNNPKASGFEDKHQVGFIAQEVEKVLPEVVNRGEDSYRSVEYGKIVSVVVAAVKELYTKVLGIDRELASVKAENTEVDAKVQKLESENEKLKLENAAIKARLDKIEKALNSK